MTDTPDGFDRAPDRYMGQERETIDRMRDEAHVLADAIVGAGISFTPEKLADLLFAFHCRATAMKYSDRAGAKGDVVGDHRKANWYRAMERHILKNGPDPRAERPDFVPYKRGGS